MSLKRKYSRLRLIGFCGIVSFTLMACSSIQVGVDQARVVKQSHPNPTAMNRKRTVAIATFKGHSERVTSVAFSPDSQLIASASYDNTVKLWNPRTSQVIRTFLVQTTDEEHNQEYNLWVEASSKLAFSRDGKILTLGNGYNALIAWQVDTGQIVKKTRGRSSYTLGTAFSPDGHYFANALNRTSPASGSVSGLARFRPDQILQRLARIVYSQEAGDIGIWDVKTGQQIATIPKTGLPTSIAFSSDNQFLVSNAFGKISLWDLKSKKLLRTWLGYGSVAISPNNEFVAVNRFGSVKVWHLKTGKEIYSVEGECGVGEALTFSSDSKLLAASTAELNAITLWDVTAGERIVTLSSPQVWSITISPNSELLATGNSDNIVRVWKMQ
ncbi:MAG TPA: WD40 repeat domain-containing protein [Leptolyngbyaceae cyanobacterium M33_DOE_097]|nr:WD40 repeat domain-containing protein [Leptolyngbyaceae cyanobacterium M33_DOE_097]